MKHAVKSLIPLATLLLLSAAGVGDVCANPTGAHVTAGGATVSTATVGGTPTVTIRQTTPTAIINWQSFNIAQGEATQFLQPSATAMVLNRIGGLTPSLIDGALQANGMVFLLNANGILFGQNAQVNVAGGLVGSTLNITDADFLAGKFQFQGAVTNGLIQNLGNLRAGANGVYLFAPNVENHGIITSPGGSIVLAAGSRAYLSNRADGRGFLAELRAPAGQALNVGQMIADGGQITMAGLVVNQNGLVQANAVQNVNGRIELVAKQDPSSPSQSPAAVTLGAGSQTIADGGEISITGQSVAHNGLIQANLSGTLRGNITVTATGGAQAGSGSLTTGATSQIVADGGDILLAGSSVAHSGTLQANSVGGQTGSIDIRARGTGGTLMTGVASLITANGGDVVLEGRTIEHAGTIQADAVADRSGHVLLMAQDQLTLRNGSQILARGAGATPSDGGTVIGMASNLATGSVTVDAGAVLDISGGAAGGHGGELLLGDRRGAAAGFDTVPFLGTAAPGYQPGRFRLIPADLNLNSSLDLGGLGPLHDVTLAALNDVTVTGDFNLANFAPGIPNARLRLIAGNDLKFQDAHIRNGEYFDLGLGTVSPRDLIGVAGNNVTLGNAPGSFDTRASTIVMGDGGNLSLTARNGNISLIDPRTEYLSSLHIREGNLTLNAQKDIITGLRIAHEYADDMAANQSLVLDSTLQGILVDGTMVTGADGSRSGTGHLTMIAAEGSLLGGKVFGVTRSPGFMVRNADATVKVGGTVGTSNLPLDSNGLLPDGAQTFLLANPQPGPDGKVPPRVVEDPSTYLDVAMTNAHVSVEAGSHIFFKRAKDAGIFFEGDGIKPGRGITEWVNGDVISRFLRLSDGFQRNQLSLVSRNGNIFVNTTDSALNQAREQDWSDIGAYLPANTTMTALAGTIQFRAGARFFNGPSAKLDFFAAQNIEGVVTYGLQGPGQFDVKWVYVQNAPAVNPINRIWGRWYPIDLRKPIPINLLPWMNVAPPRGADSPPTNATLPASFFTLVPKNSLALQLSKQSPDVLLGTQTNFGSSPSFIRSLLDRGPVGSDRPPLTSPGLMQFRTATGDIRNLNLLMSDQTYLKQVVLRSGGDIRNIILNATVPQLGTEVRTVTELVPVVRDGQTGLYRMPRKDESVRAQDVVQVPVDVTVNVQKPSVVVEASGTIDLNLSDTTGSSGIRLVGDGVASIRAGGDLNLGNSQGIRLSPGVTPRGSSTQAGLLDIAVGNNLRMTQSLIMTDGGGGISIHGINPSYIPGYDNSSLHPVEVPIEVRGTLNQSLVGGNVEVGTSAKSTRSGDSTGIQVRIGGSVGVKTPDTSTVAVNNAGGTPTINPSSVMPERDPAAINIQARGDVNVNTSRIGTFAGGDIRIVSTQGSINAGSGGKNEQQQFGLDVPAFDRFGHPILNPDGTPKYVRENYLVPGSGIFTYHPLDPTTLNFPKFDTPALTALKAEIQKQRFFGRDTSALEARFNALSKAREREFDAIFEKFITQNPDKPEFVNGQPTGRFLPLQLGDVSLNAGLDIVIPPAGIRGRRVDLIAGRTLDFQGGEVQGKVTFKAQNLSGDVKVTGTFAGSSAGGGSVSVTSSGGSGSVGGLSGSTGTVAATSASTSASVSTAQKATESVQESAANVPGQQKSQQVAKKGEEKDGDTKKKSIAMRDRRGVEIEVDVKPKAAPSGG